MAEPRKFRHSAYFGCGQPGRIPFTIVSTSDVPTPAYDYLGIATESPQPVIPRIPLGRLGTTQDITKVVSFFASHERSYIAGTRLAQDGCVTRVCTTHPRSEQLQKYIFVAIFVAGDSLPGSVSRGIFAMGAAKALRTIAGLPFGAGLLVNAYVFAAPEPTTPDSPFTLGSSTAATVTSYSPVIGDNGQFPSTTASVYNLFGATNTSVENNGDIIFGDNNSQPNAVAFTTPAPVYLIGIVAYLDSDDGTLDGPRSVGTVTFTANGSEVVFTVNGSEVVDPAPVNESVAVDGGSNVFMFAQPVMASTFVVTFSANPNLNFTPDANNDGVGPRIFELDGIVPEPTSLGMLALGALGLFARPRRA